MSSPPQSAPATGKARIYLVGAGPGDPDLLTIAAQKALMSADLVVADRLVSSEILAHVQHGEVRVANKVPGKADEAQDELSEWCLEGLNEGKVVVRLKIGDPFVFGRGGEEVLWFRERGFEPIVIPGISSALAAPLEALIPVTHRALSDTIIISTGRGKGGAVPNLPVYDKDHTLVLLMAVGRISSLADMLVKEKAYPTDVPVAVIENATCPGRREVRGALCDIGDIVQAEGIQAPAVVVIGRTVSVLS